MEFIPDEPVEAMYVGEAERVDDTAATCEVYGLPLYDLPDDFDSDAVVVIIKGFWGDDDFPSLLYRTSSNLAPWEIQAMLAEGMKETLE